MIRIFLIACTAFLCVGAPMASAQTGQSPAGEETPTAEPEFNPVTITVTASGNLRDMADRAGYDGAGSARYLFIVPPDVNILGEAGGKRGGVDGGPGLATGSWPSDAELWLMIKGHVYGGGGRGGNGGAIPGATDGGRGATP